jgi:hypothetical protein
MGENVKVDEKQSTAGRLREEIRHTEGDITDTVLTLEHRLSPRYLRQQGVRKVKHLAWEGTAKALDLAQRTPVQAMVLGSAGALLMLLTNRKAHRKVAAPKAVRPPMEAGTVAKAAGAGTLWLLTRKRRGGKPEAAKKPALSGMALAATAAKAFFSGARATKKTGTTRPGKKVAWRGVATAIGAALGSYWYSHKGHRV